VYETNKRQTEKANADLGSLRAAEPKKSGGCMSVDDFLRPNCGRPLVTAA